MNKLGFYRSEVLFAIVFVSTSIVLASGFLALVQSDFSVNSTSGLLVAITIAIAILLDWLFLPTVLIKMDRWRISEIEH